LAYDGQSVIARKFWKSAFYLAFVIQTPFYCFAAERYVFDVFDQDRGLGNAAVTRLAQDHQGFLWIGTENGLYRYDGYRFLAFTTSDGLPGNKITAIHESPDGTLWVGTVDGLAWREATRFRKSGIEALKGYINLQGIASDSTGRVFIATRKGVAVTSPPTKGKDVQVAFLPWPRAVPLEHATNVYVVSPNEVWFGCDTAICQWNGKDIRVWDRAVGVPPQRWDFFLRDKLGNLWARNRDALIELASGANRFQTIDPHVPVQLAFPPELAMDSKGRILVTTDRGLVIGDPAGWMLVTQKQGLPIASVTAILQDAEGSMWVGTYGAGLARWAGYDAWRSFTELEGLAGSSIWSLLDDPPSGMWVGTAAGLSHGVFSKGTWNWSEVSIPGVGGVSSLARAKDGALWMRTDSHYVARYDPVTRASRRLGPFGQGPYHLQIDGAGRVWIADSGSVAVGGDLSRLQDFERIRPPGATESTAFTAVLEDPRGDLWIGSFSGLFRRSHGKWFRYDKSSGLRATRITDLTLSPEGDVWVSYSEPKGADRVRAAGDTVQVENFDRSKGLISDRVNSTAFDRKGQLWILNDHGVAVRRGDTWVQFGRADGLIASGSTGRAFWAAADGAIWIGSERGLSRYEPPDTVEARAEPLRVKYSEVRIGQKTLDPELGAFVETTPQAFVATFSALLLAHGPEVRYRYRIAGFDDRWQETTRPEVRLDYLPAGRYRLEVQARRETQPWMGPAAALALEVLPRWYETSLFRGMFLALVCASLWLVAKVYQRNAAAARQTLERTVKQRTAELQESEQRFRNMADTAPVMIWISGPDKLCTFFNQGWLNFTGRTIEQELGSGWAASVHPEDLNRRFSTYSASFDARRNFEMEYRLRRADGEYRWVLDAGIPRFTSDGVFAGYIGCCTDITQSKSAEHALRELSGQLMRLQEEERRRIARELHDSAGQNLAALKMNLTRLAHTESSSKSREVIADSLTLTNTTLSEIRIISYLLHPPLLDQLGLAGAVRTYIDGINARSPIHVYFEIDPDLGRLAPDLETALFRIIQEGLTNVHKHSGSEQCWVSIRKTDAGVALEIRDDGAGLPAGIQASVANGAPTVGLGLSGMRERARHLGGHLEIESSERGCVIRAVFAAGRSRGT
jgi:PAS domain S-box-containing protein